MPPMATTSYKRKWSEISMDEEYDKQSIIDMCTSKLRYINPAIPPRRRTEVPLLRNVLIVNTIKHLAADTKTDFERPLDVPSEDLPTEPGHFEGLPPLSELLTDIMLDPHPSETPLTPLAVQSSLPSYMDTENTEDKIVHDLLPCTSVHGISPNQSSWASHSASPMETYITSQSEPLPSFMSLFDSSSPTYTEPQSAPSYTELTSSSNLSQSYTYTSTETSTHTSSVSQQTVGALAEDLVGNTSLTEAELVYLAMEFSSKLPHLSFEELVQHALPYQQQNSSQSYFVPSTLHSCGNSANSTSDGNSSTSSPDESMVRVLVDL